MQPLNPFLRAFFASKLPSQCSPTSHHIILAPTTELLLSNRDRESQVEYREYATSEEFLSSHVLRIPNSSRSGFSAREGFDLKDTKGKTRQYATFNGKTVIIKDAHVFSNKGFKTLAQAQLLHDEVYYAETFEPSQWLIYYISKPLLGSPEPLNTKAPNGDSQGEQSKSGPGLTLPSSVSSLHVDRVKTFGDILATFPLVARQVQSTMEKLTKQFGTESSERDLSQNGTTENSRRDSNASLTSLEIIKSPKSYSSTLSSREIELRRSLEKLVMSSIELFQRVDKEQLAIVGSSTNFSGQTIEYMIERFVTEQVHDKSLFPIICDVHKDKDEEFDRDIKQMGDVDICQVGITIEEGQDSRRSLSTRIVAGVEIFKKMNDAQSPQEMLEILLETEKCLTSPSNSSKPVQDAEKSTSLGAMNADTLVSLFLIVVIRSSVNNLSARLSYMRGFNILADVESGETGYALSTLEAVLAYLASNSIGLRRISRANRLVWQAVKKGDIHALRNSLEPDAIMSESPKDDIDSHHVELKDRNDDAGLDFSEKSDRSMLNGDGLDHTANISASPTTTPLNEENLALITRGEIRQSREEDALRPKLKKRVSMDTRSLSSSSLKSIMSLPSTIGSKESLLRGETSVEQLSRTEDHAGNSLLLMAVEASRPESLAYLLQLEHLFPMTYLLEDRNNDGTTIFNAAFQMGNRNVINTLLDHVLHRSMDDAEMQAYFNYQDSMGRTAAHYLFNTPDLIERLGSLIPWQLKDKNGQTPLFTLCRSYDHEKYREMVQLGIKAASLRTGPLHVDDHADNKGNTLLHVVTDPEIIRSMLYTSDSDPNAPNEKGFTPLMVATKFARLDSVRIFYNDPRTDLQARDNRGLTAVELAKDEDVRNRIDDMVLLSTHAGSDGRRTTVARSGFFEDGVIRLILKSGAPNSNSTITVTTCRRSLGDFELLARWLAMEHPASWLPSVSDIRNPIQIPGKPSRQVLRDIQLRFDHFLKTLLSHPTFRSHELVWEFFLVPDIDPSMLDERTKRKAEARVDRLKDEYEPLTENVTEVQSFVRHARTQIVDVETSTKYLLRGVTAFRNTSSDLAEAYKLSSKYLTDLSFLPEGYLTAFSRYASVLTQSESSPWTDLHYELLTTIHNTTAILAALSRPSNLIGSIAATHETLERHRNAATRTQRWPSALGLLDDTRARVQQESREKAAKALGELESLGCELRYTQQTVASELAGWQETHPKEMKETLRSFAKRMIVVERARLQGMRRAVRLVEKEKLAGSQPSRGASRS